MSARGIPAPGRPLVEVLDELVSCPWLRLRQEYKDGEANFMVMIPVPRPEAPDYWEEEYWSDPALVELFADLETGRRSVSVVSKDSLKRVVVPADFWTMYRWEIHRGPPATLREHGAEWAACKPEVTSKVRPGRPAKSIDRAEARKLLDEQTQKAGHQLKRDHAAEILRSTGVSRRDAHDVWRAPKSG